MTTDKVILPLPVFLPNGIHRNHLVITFADSMKRLLFFTDSVLLHFILEETFCDAQFLRSS